MLCGNRFPLPGSPSTCDLDTIIVPLPSIILIFVLLFWSIRRSNKLDAAASFAPSKWIHIVYLCLVGAACAMTILELARLVAEDLGVGLLPITTITLIVVWGILFRERRGRTRAIIMILITYWVFIAIAEALKSGRLRELEILNPNTTKTSKYPSSDQLLDNAVMCALYLVFFLLECINLVIFRRTRRVPSNDYTLRNV